ncbi:MAG: TolC family protein [Sphingobacteriales bacterium]|nr:MAG: TolC family protein [Sphingobacteriales bacterium]
MRLWFTSLLIACCLCNTAFAQNDVWSLQRSVQYAIDHNISIQQNVLNQRLAKLALQQSQLAQLPNANVSSSYGRSFGRSVDPTTNQFVEGSSYDFLSLGGSVDVLVFGWFQKRNNIAKNNFSLKAADADLDQLVNDVSLNVATGYLRALLAQEQINVARKQVELSDAQLQQTQAFATAGRLPELNVAQLQAQLASDSSNLITAISDFNAAILDIKALLNLDFQTDYKLEIPNVNVQDQLAVNSMTPEDIYYHAAARMGSVRGAQMRLFAAEKNYAATKGTLWPQISLGAQLGTNWASTYKEIVGAPKFTGSGTPTGNYVPVLDTILPVYQPEVTYQTRTIPLGKQIDNNFRQTVSVNLNIPLFNAWQTQYSTRQAKINVLTQQLNKYNTELKLRQDVYKAHNDAGNAIQKYKAAARAVEAAQRAYDFAEKRYDLGLTNTVEYLTTQNSLYQAESRLASAKYDLIFKLKVIDYYLGKELKL